jgi:hypothetical protein
VKKAGRDVVLMPCAVLKRGVSISDNRAVQVRGSERHVVWGTPTDLPKGIKGVHKELMDAHGIPEDLVESFGAFRNIPEEKFVLCVNHSDYYGGHGRTPPEVMRELKEKLQGHFPPGRKIRFVDVD